MTKETIEIEPRVQEFDPPWTTVSMVSVRVPHSDLNVTFPRETVHFGLQGRKLTAVVIGHERGRMRAHGLYTPVGDKDGVKTVTRIGDTYSIDEREVNPFEDGMTVVWEEGDD